MMRRLIAGAALTTFITVNLLASAPLMAEDEAGEPAVLTVQRSSGPTEDAAPTPEPTSGSEEVPALPDSADSEAAESVPAGEFQPIADSQVPADQAIVPSSKGLDELVSLDLRNIEVSDALRFIALKGGLNMAVSKSVSGRVQLLLNNVPIRDILDIILITNGLAFDKRGDVYNIMTEGEYQARYGRKFSDAREVKLFKLNYAVPEQAFSLFEVLKSEIGRLLVDPESGTVLVMDSPQNIERMGHALQAMEEKKSVKVYTLKYAKASEVETRLKTRLDSKKVGFVVADERTNSVIVETLPGRMQEIDDIVSSLDTKTKEVLIDAKIIKVTIKDDFDAEIKWEGLLKEIQGGSEYFTGNHVFDPVFRASRTFIDNYTKITPTTTPAQGGKHELTENLVIGGVGENSFELLINFLRTLGDTKIISNPKLAVINNQEAKIHVGEKQAYVTTTTTTGQTTTTTAEAVTFVDVGIQLNVTPTINDDGYVTMKIKPEISSVLEYLTTPSGNKIPIIDSSLAETAVMVKDGVSIIIGGLRGETKTENRKKVPFLGDIPIIGAPFNSFSKGSLRTELLIIMTPHVVQGDTLINNKGRAVGAEPYLTYADYVAASSEANVNLTTGETMMGNASYPPLTSLAAGDKVKGAAVTS